MVKSKIRDYFSWTDEEVDRTVSVNYLLHSLLVVESDL